MKKILMLTSEAVPFCKTGGLADVVSALSRELSEQEYDVRIMMPRYFTIDPSTLTKRYEALGIPKEGGEEWAGVYETVLPDSNVPVYLLDHEEYYGRDGIYGSRPDEGYEDNAARYALLSRASFQLCRMLHWIPDVIHCHDWTVAPACYLLKQREQYRDFGNTASVLTIHNLGYQGVFSLEDAHLLHWHDQDFTSLEFSGALNYLKSGVVCADEITTVSPTYAEEICRPDMGFGLDGLLRYRREDLRGILNGIDYSQWNPASDPHIAPYNFDADNTRNKNMVKKKLQKRMELEVKTNVPLIGIVSRMVEQKGFRELCGPGYGSLVSICQNMDLQFVILGSGDKWCEDELSHLSSYLPNLAVYIGYNDELAHQIEGGCDFFLMPSRYEPCGLNQIYSLSYGTLPIVRNTGGLADTVENYDETKGTGTGFVFDDLNPGVLYDMAGWVCDTWYNRRNHIRKMRKTAMKKEFSWTRSAEQYGEVYDKALAKKN